MKSNLEIFAQPRNLKIVVLALLTAFAASCDKVDIDPDINKDIELRNTTVFIRPNSSAIIDLAAKVNSTQSLTVAVTSPTSKGNLISMGNGLMQYSLGASTSSVNARDAFAFTLYNSNNETVKKDSIIIIVQPDSTSLPIGIYPADDIIFGVTGRTPFTLEVLKNDYLSTYSVNDLTLSIYTPQPTFPPYYGTAVVSGSSIVYTPGDTFSGADKLIYKLSVKSNPTIQAFGYVALIGNPICNFSLTNDVFVSTQAFTEVRVPILANDQLCNAQTSFSVTISQAPARGSAFIENDLLVYRPSQIAENRFVDSLTYRVTIDGVSKSTQVSIKVNTDSIGACALTAVNDTFEVSSSATQSFVLDVIQNDILCGREVDVEIVSSPTAGTASVITQNGKKNIRYTLGAQTGEYDKFTYRIKSSDRNSEASVLIKRTN